MERLMELVNNAKITWAELEEIKVIPDVEIEDFGMSGLYNGYNWYVVKTTEGAFSVYVK